eukprot:154181_1
MIVIFALLHLLCLTVSYAMSYGSWQIGGSMPLPNHMMAVGYDATNETIWLVGGDADGSASQQLLAFDIVTQTSIEIRLQNQTRLSHSVWGNQFFTQIGNILWMINDVEKEYPNKAQGFSIFNVMTSQFIYDFNDIIVPVNTRELACLASTIDDNHNSYLFVVGGKLLDYSMDLTQIFNISSNTWLTNAPSMDTSRNAFSCIIHNDKLFSIGGHEHNVAPYYLDSIEVLDVSTANLHSFAVQWQYIDPLNMPRARTNAVAYMDKVLVIGGEPSGNPGGSSNAIHVIDTVSDTVTYYGDSLVTGLYHTASVVVNGALFVFGGQTDSIVDIWQYTVLPTPEPTTSNPTSIPSSNPTAMSYGSWQIGGSMPLRNHQMAVGYDATNDIIWLLGGSDEYNAKKQLLAFDVVTQTSVQLRQQNQTRLSHDIWGMQHFTQIDNILWMINAKTSPFATQGFSIFNVITSQFIYDYNGIIIPANTREMGCLASTTDNNDNAYLFVVGGQDADYNALSLTQIYNISSNEWLTNAPSMGTSRGAFSCIAHNHKLYSIGGWNYIAPYYLDSIEVLDVSTANLHSFTATWKYIDSLNKPRDSTNAVRYMDKVLAIGGGPSGNQGTASKEIHVIDTVSDTVTYYGESLAIAVYLTAPVVVNGTLFAFGGYAYGSGQASIQNWQYTVLPTPEPTTSNPTSIPTSNPTRIPTILTKEPAVPPATIAPTVFPTANPLVYPTHSPTALPSTSPTVYPSIFPTISPSSYPTEQPTIIPTLLPSITFTLWPIILVTENTTNTLSVIIDKTENGNDESFIGIVAIMSSCVSCILMGCALFCIRHKPQDVVHAKSEGNHALEDVRRQQTPTQTPPGVHVSGPSASLPESTLPSISIAMEGMIMEAKGEESGESVLNDVLNDVLRQPSRNDSEQMYVKHVMDRSPTDDVDSGLKSWLTVNGFGHYVNNFVSYGYDSLEFLKDIQDAQDLSDIGIT